MENPKIKILYLDDEEENLIGFKASFRFRYEIFTTSNHAEALKIFDENPDIQVILSDQRMPEKTGVELFEILRSKFPYPVRILITGYTDIESIIDAVNRGHIFRYIKKPWVENDIITAIDEAHKFYLTTSLLAIKNKELKKAYDDLDKFAHSVTHDLKGPMMSFKGAIDILEKEENPAKAKELLGWIKETAEKLDEFIDSIQDYYRINRGELEIRSIDFQEMVDDMKDIYTLNEKVNSITLKTQVTQTGKFKSDTLSIKLIINNLLSNAFKYQRKDNEDKWVEISIVENKYKAIITIKDNGIGIELDYIDQIFNMFYRATNEAFGSGFGLYNVKDTLKRIGGEIEVKSTENVGTEFTVTLPNKSA